MKIKNPYKKEIAKLAILIGAVFVLLNVGTVTKADECGCVSNDAINDGGWYDTPYDTPQSDAGTLIPRDEGPSFDFGFGADDPTYGTPQDEDPNYQTPYDYPTPPDLADLDKFDPPYSTPYDTPNEAGGGAAPYGTPGVPYSTPYFTPTIDTPPVLTVCSGTIKPGVATRCSFNILPSSVRKDSKTEIFWYVEGLQAGDTCSLTSLPPTAGLPSWNGVGSTWSNPPGYKVTISQKTIFTLSCTTAGGSTSSVSKTVNIVPEFHEI